MVTKKMVTAYHLILNNKLYNKILIIHKDEQFNDHLHYIYHINNFLSEYICN